MIQRGSNPMEAKCWWWGVKGAWYIGLCWGGGGTVPPEGWDLAWVWDWTGVWDCACWWMPDGCCCQCCCCFICSWKNIFINQRFGLGTYENNQSRCKDGYYFKKTLGILSQLEINGGKRRCQWFRLRTELKLGGSYQLSSVLSSLLNNSSIIYFYFRFSAPPVLLFLQRWILNITKCHSFTMWIFTCKLTR